MPQRKRKTSSQDQQQPYDNLLKSLLEGREKEMLPYFLAEAEYQETLDIEVHRTTLRVDRVYKIMYRKQLHILHLEFESGSDSDMDARLLDYHSYLYRKYKLPVLSIIVYPFRTSMATSPLQEMSGEIELLRFNFQVFPLWQLHAEKYIKDHVLFMYALLPTMDGANASLLNIAINQMIEYYKNDNDRLARELRWMGIVLRRADTVALNEKRIVEERLNMYDDLMERDPKMIQIRAESEARGEAKGEAKGETKGLQEGFIDMVETLFPELADLARQRVAGITETVTLRLLLKGVAAASDEAEAKRLLDLSA